MTVGASGSDQVPDLKYFDLTQMSSEHFTPLSAVTRSSGQSTGVQRTLSPFETYIALCKGYCVILVLILPKAFVVGGFGVSALLELASGFVSTLAVCLLV